MIEKDQAKQKRAGRGEEEATLDQGPSSFYLDLKVSSVRNINTSIRTKQYLLLI